MELARQWGLADLAYFYTTSTADAQLEASSLTDAYLIRTTNSAADALVLVVKQAGRSAVVRYLFKRVKENEWRSVHGDVCVSGTFTDFLKVLIGTTRAVPLVDVERVKQQQEQQRSRSLQEQTLRVVRKNSAPQVAAEWLAVVRANALVALDPVHNDVDGVSLALEPHYLGADIDALGAAALLAGRPPRTFLVRLGGVDRRQTVVSAVRASGQLGHVVMDRAALIRPTVRESILATPEFRLPLTRSAVEREFVPCTVRLAEQPLGSGAASVVLRGTLDNRIDVALKKLVTAATAEATLFAEADSMFKIAPHPNVACLFGLVLAPPALVLEFCDGGSLDQALGLEDLAHRRVFSDAECRQLALGVARGMAHLHAARIVHRDLASRNVLLRLAPLTAKVSDFGMSRIVDDDGSGQTMTLAGPIKWQAPEQFRGTPRQYSLKSDVFSFAVLLTELVGNRLPWPDVTNMQAAVAVHRGERTPVPERMTPPLRSVVDRCWAQAADARPSMADVVAMLEADDD
jgi:hypothetical protein